MLWPVLLLADDFEAGWPISKLAKFKMGHSLPVLHVYAVNLPQIEASLV